MPAFFSTMSSIEPAECPHYQHGFEGADMCSLTNIYQHHLVYPLVNIQKAMENPPCLMGKSTISMAMFNCYLSSPEGIHHDPPPFVQFEPVKSNICSRLHLPIPIPIPYLFLHPLNWQPGTHPFSVDRMS